MKENTKHNNMWIFWLELILAAVVPFTICWSMISTNVLNSVFLFSLLEPIVSIGNSLALFARIPVGIIGIRKAKHMQKRQIITVVLSLLNLSIGIIGIVILILILYAVIFGGASA